MSGLRTSLKDPDLQENLYVYDDAGRLSKMQVAASRTAYFAYDPSGMVVRRHAPLNEVVAYFTYDSAARLKQLENRAVTGALLSYFAYQRNALGAQTWIRHEGAEDTYFEYDPLDRLTREFRTPTGTARSHDDYYAYDAVGNRVLKVDRTASQNVYYTFDARNLMAKEWNKDAPETTYFEHDAARRMKSLKLPGGQSSYFTHDQRDQVKKIEFAKASSPDSTQEFGYTGQGERVSLKIGNGSTTDLRLAYDGQKLLTEKNAASGSATVRRYRHNRSLLDCMGSAIEWDFGGTRRYGAFNGQGTLVGLLQDFGGGEVLSDSIVRDAFGKLVTRGTLLGTDQGKLQFLSAPMLDMQLGNAQMSTVTHGGLFLPKYAATSTLSGALLGSAAIARLPLLLCAFSPFIPGWGPAWDPAFGGPDDPTGPGPDSGTGPPAQEAKMGCFPVTGTVFLKFPDMPFDLVATGLYFQMQTYLFAFAAADASAKCAEQPNCVIDMNPIKGVPGTQWTISMVPLYPTAHHFSVDTINGVSTYTGLWRDWEGYANTKYPCRIKRDGDPDPTPLPPVFFDQVSEQIKQAQRRVRLIKQPPQAPPGAGGLSTGQKVAIVGGAVLVGAAVGWAMGGGKLDRGASEIMSLPSTLPGPEMTASAP